MGIENLMMRFDNPSGVFYAGQMVTGSIQFVVTKPYQSDGVFVRFTGRADTHWTESRTVGTGDNRRTETVHYRGREVYFDQKVCVYNPPGGNLVPYNYSFNFALQLPMHIPSSFIGSVGKIHYQVKGNVHRSGFHLSKNCILPFSVVGIKDLNLMPQLQNSVQLNNHKTFGVLLWKSKPLTATLSINKQAFVSGENILVSGIINNESDVKIKECELKLIKHVEYRAQGHRRSETKTVYKCSKPAIEKGSAANWSNVPVFVPCLPPSGLDGCNIISTNYTLLIRIVPPGMRFALELTFAITVGTIPFRSGIAPSCAGYPSNPIPGPAHQPGGAGYAPMPGQGGAGYAPPQMPGAGGSGYPPQPMPGQSGAGYPPQPMPGAGGVGYPPLPPGEGYAPPPFPGSCGAGPIPEKEPIPGYSNNSAVPSAPTALVPPPYGDITPTYGDYLGDSTEPPSYDSLFQGAPGNDDDDEDAKDYKPKYPTFNIP